MEPILVKFIELFVSHLYTHLAGVIIEIDENGVGQGFQKRGGGGVSMNILQLLESVERIVKSEFFVYLDDVFAPMLAEEVVMLRRDILRRSKRELLRRCWRGPHIRAASHELDSIVTEIRYFVEDMKKDLFNHVYVQCQTTVVRAYEPASTKFPKVRG